MDSNRRRNDTILDLIPGHQGLAAAIVGRTLADGNVLWSVPKSSFMPPACRRHKYDVYG